MYEFWAIFSLALLFIAVYFVGSNQNRKLNVKYAKAIKEYMTPHSEFVGFRAYGRNGFRSLCRLKREEPFSRIEVAVALVDRENLMHYLLSPITKDCDRLVCWGFLKNKIPSNTEILSRVDEKLRKRITSEGKFKEIIVKESGLSELLTFMTVDVNFAERLLSNSNVRRNLFETRNFVKRLSLSRQESWVYLIAELREESLLPLLNLILSCGEALS
jgi:hypothetical protein